MPGNPHIPPDRDLVSFWRSKGNERFQNYEAYFTILDEGEIRKEWIHDLLYDHSNLRYAPHKWKKYIKEGKEGIVALSAKSVIEMPTKYQQMQTNEDGRLCLSMIREFCNGKRSQIFEQCAVDIVSKMDAHFKSCEITRPWRDGGRDAARCAGTGNCRRSAQQKVDSDCVDSLSGGCGGRRMRYGCLFYPIPIYG